MESISLYLEEEFTTALQCIENNVPHWPREDYQSYEAVHMDGGLPIWYLATIYKMQHWATLFVD